MMKMYYSPTTRGFYTREIHQEIPSDAIEITDQYHRELIDGESNGKAISPGDDGYPVLVDPPPLDDDQVKENMKIERATKVAQIKVTTSTGHIFDGDETSQNRMSRAVSIGGDDDTIEWKLADNTKAVVTISELKEALSLAGQEQTRIWME